MATVTVADVVPITGKDEETFIYATVNGEPTHQKTITKNPYRAFWRVMDEDRGWVEAEIGDELPAVVYNAFDVGEASTVYVFEDERSADAVMRVAPEGVAATCNPQRGEKFGPEMAEAFTGKDVIVWRERAADGQRWASMIAAELEGCAKSVRIVEPATDYKDGESGEYDSVIDHLEAGFSLEDAKPADDKNETATLLDDLVIFFRRFITFPTKHHAKVLSLWTLHTYVLDRDLFQFTPYLWIYSPEKESGKSKVQELLALVVMNPWRIITPSEAAIYRTLNKTPKCLLWDEIDTVFNERGAATEGLRAILNAGFEKGAEVTRCNATSFEPANFKVFSAKCIAGIGLDNVPDTVRGRSIPFPMKRRKATEQVERLRARQVKVEIEPLVERLVAWSGKIDFGKKPPPWFDKLGDRQADIWEVLLAVADMAGEKWGLDARAAAVAMHSVADGEAEVEGALLLADIAGVFLGTEGEPIFSAELLEKLNGLETSPWATFRNGAGLSVQKLAAMLRPYGAKPVNIRIGSAEDGSVRKGYRLESFWDAFGRYIPSEAFKSLHRYNSTETGTYSDTEPSDPELDFGKKPNGSGGVDRGSGVAAQVATGDSSELLGRVR